MLEFLGQSFLLLPLPREQPRFGRLFLALTRRSAHILVRSRSCSTPLHTFVRAVCRGAGKLMGIAIRNKEYLDLFLSPAVWKLIAGEPLTEADLKV